MNIEEYLKTVGEQIRCKAARGPVQEEIRGHIEDQKADFLRAGMDEQEAEAAAVLEMGDPVETGVALDEVHRPKMAWGMILLIAGLSLVGLLMQISIKQNLPEFSYPYVLSKYFIILLFGLAVMILFCYMDYTRIGKHAKLKMFVLTGILLLGTLVFGMSVNGMKIFIYFAGITVNVKLVVPIFAPFYGAVLYSYRGQGYKALGKGILWMLPVLYITMSCPSVTYTLMMFLTFAAILLFAVYKGWYQVAKRKVLLTGAGILVMLPVIIYGLIMTFGMEYQKARIQAYIQLLFNPESMAKDMGYQMMAIREALDGSRMIGESANALEVIQLIPEIGDYILVYMISYYGILIGIAVMSLMLFLFGRMLRSSLRQKNQLGMIMGFGCCAAFFIQILFYILGNMGLIIFASTYCPFITYGGSGMVISYAMLGILLSIYRYQNVVPVNGYISKKSKVRLKLIVERTEGDS